MKLEQQEQLEFIRGLAKILIDNKMESLEAYGIKLQKSKHMEIKERRPLFAPSEEQPTEDMIMNFALEEPIPTQDAIMQALSAQSEPKKQRRVRKEIA